MAGKTTRWTAEALATLRSWDGIVPDRRIAEIIGCTYWAVVTKKKELRLADGRLEEMPPLQRLIRTYHATQTLIESLGVERLCSMDQTTRDKTVWRALGRHPAAHTDAERTARIARMVHLSSRIARLKKYKERAA
jgi:hypothetical protein